MIYLRPCDIENEEGRSILKGIEAMPEIDAIMTQMDEAVYRSVETEPFKDVVVAGGGLN